MKTVVLYGFEGEFVGGNEYDYNHPELHHAHKCILFLAQDSEHPDFEFATTECSKFGFANLKNLTGKPLNKTNRASQNLKNGWPCLEKSSGSAAQLRNFSDA